MYIRDLRKPSPNKNVFKFASEKVGQAIMCESTLEFDACFHNEYNNSIESYGTQPEGFKYNFRGKMLPYTPDTLVRYIDKSEKFHEYKPYSAISSPIFREKFIARKLAAKQLGIELILVTDRQIRVNPILNNLKLLHRYSGVYGVTYIQHKLLQAIQKSGQVKLNDVSEEFNLSLGESRSFLYALIHKGFLIADLSNEDLTCNPTLWTA
ncbi:MAG: TnsA endonuclease N-terminal domain-containing protein [Psychromonas sp.]